MPRLLVAFPQCAHDPASGAARSTRLIGEWLAAAGWEVRSVTAAFSEARRWCTSRELGELAGEMLAEEPGGWTKFSAGGVAHRVLAAERTGQVALDAAAVQRLADGVRRALRMFRPDVLLTYGDDAVWRQLRAEAAQLGVRVVYAVHNAAHSAGAFEHTAAVLAPSRWLMEHYQRRGVRGIEVLPPPIDPAEVVASDPDRVFTTFINPSPEKGRAVFIGIAKMLAERESMTPLLVVEGRAKGADLIAAAMRGGVDLRAMTNLMIASAVRNPREIFRVTRTLIVPSLSEAAGRVVAEAQLNGIPCLVSNRGGLPEMCGDGGRVVNVPDSVTLDTEVAHEGIEAWVTEIDRLASDEACYARIAESARKAGARFDSKALSARYAEWFGRVETREALLRNL